MPDAKYQPDDMMPHMGLLASYHTLYLSAERRAYEIALNRP